MENQILLLQESCLQIYNETIAPELSEKDKKVLADIFMENPHNLYQYHQPIPIATWQEEGADVERLKYLTLKLCNGTNNVNKEIKNFLLQNNYIKENNGKLELTDKLTFQTPNNNNIGGCTKQDTNGNTLIIINGEFMKRSNSSLAIALGHEICHCMINKKLGQCGTSSEVEALCDIIGLSAAKGAGYDISHIPTQNNIDYNKQKQMEQLQPYKKYLESQGINIEKKVQETLDFYQPQKLNRIAEIINQKIPLSENKIERKLYQLKQKISKPQKQNLTNLFKARQHEI